MKINTQTVKKKINYLDWAKIKGCLHRGEFNGSDIPIPFVLLGVVTVLLSLKIAGVISEQLFAIFALGLLSLAMWRHSQ